jgi:hypothetical protein
MSSGIRNPHPARLRLRRPQAPGGEIMFADHCIHCGRNTMMLTVNEAFVLARCSRRTIYYWIAKGKLHLFELPSGRTLICMNSIVRPYCKANKGRNESEDHSLCDS